MARLPGVDHRRVDLVLIVAGTHAEIRAWELTEANAMALLKTNLHGVIGTVATAPPALLAQGRGALSIVASVAVYRGLPKALIHGASKAALMNFTETLYLDLRSLGSLPASGPANAQTAAEASFVSATLTNCQLQWKRRHIAPPFQLPCCQDRDLRRLAHLHDLRGLPCTVDN